MRVYDCFIFNNELDLLEARLNILKDSVDFFVLVESNTTFSGNMKPMWYSISQRRFHGFPIIPVVVRDMPNTENRWEREAWQRDAIMRGLLGAEPGDLILVSDADEIPKPEAIAWAAQYEKAAFSLKTYYYNLCSVSQQFLIGTCSMKWGTGLTPNQLRNERGQWPRYEHGAWHFSFFGGMDMMETKIHSFSHAEFDDPYWTDPKRLERVVNMMQDPFEREQFPLQFEELNPSLPAYILDHLERYPSWLPDQYLRSSASTAQT